MVEAQYDKATIDNCISKNTQSGWSYVFFPDVPISEWFAKYVCVAKDKGIIGGYPDGTFKPADKINFVEAAKIIVNAFGYTVSSDTVWYKPFVEKLSEKKSIPTTITDLTKSITRGEMAEMIYRLQKEISNKSTMEFKNSALVKAADTSTSTSACADFPDKLDSCTKYSCKFLHPFTGEEMTKQILGLENDKCHYTEEMPNDGKMECYYPSSLRKAVAQEYKDLQSAQDTSVSVKIGSEGTKVTYTVDGKTVSSPSQEALDSGACVVSGY